MGTIASSDPSPPRIALCDAASFSGGPPHDQLRWLRVHDPVHRHPEPDDGPGFWAVTRHAEVRAVGRDPATFSSRPSVLIPDSTDVDAAALGDHAMLLMSDPPRHTALRRMLSREFTPRAVDRRRARMAALAREIVDRVAPRGDCDLVEDLAGEMPSLVLAELLGIPHDEGRALYRLTETIHAAPETVPPGAAMAAVAEMFGRAHEVFARKRDQPGDDLCSQLLAAGLDEIDCNLWFLLLVDAAGDTTRNLIGGGMLALFEHPEQRALLQGDLDVHLPGAIEEMLRWVSPVVYMRRTATRDTELAGRAIATGDKVVMYYGSANRDDAVFDDPERFDVRRSPNPHVAFGGGGPHYCLGAHLARLEIDAMLREVLTRLPDVEPAGDVEWLASTFVSGPRHLPVRFTPTSTR